MSPLSAAAPWAVAGCVLLAACLLGGLAERRLQALHRPSTLAAASAPGPPGAAAAPRLTAGSPWWPARPDWAEVAQVATAAAELAVLLRAGLPPAAAWAALPGAARPGTVGAALTAAVRAAQGAGDVADALARAADTGKDCSGPTARALRSLAATWHVAQHTGAPTAEVLERLAASLRADVDAASARDVTLAAPRATARLLAALPAAGLLLGWLVGADPVGVLLGTTAGRISGAVGAGCTVAGWWWTGRLVAAAQREAVADPRRPRRR